MHDISTAVVPSSSDPSGKVPHESLPAAVGTFLWELPPRNILILLLKAYRKVVSPPVRPGLPFLPPLLLGLRLGSSDGAWRREGQLARSEKLAKCHPWNAGGVDHVPPPVTVIGLKAGRPQLLY